jgi:hypothetical protein
MAFLQQFIDPSLRVTKADTPESLTGKEVERLQELHAIATASMAIPRRLGGDASDEELALDKKCGRRVAHVAEQCLKSWGTEPKPISKNIGRAAAQVRWSRWMAEHLLYLDQRMRYVATWQYKTGGDEKWAKGALTRLANEQRWLEYALRDAPN